MGFACRSLQKKQRECLGVVRKSKISVMTRRLRRLEPLDPEGESRKRSYPTARSFGRDGLRGPVGRKHGGCTNSRRSIRRAPKRPSSTIGRGWAESSQRGRTPVESGTALSSFRTIEVPTPKREAATLAVAVVHSERRTRPPIYPDANIHPGHESGTTTVGYPRSTRFLRGDQRAIASTGSCPGV